ncbi:MAG: PQQ-binding-like beta-propeller repeat protein [Armatimonadota bacterium]
MRGLILAGGAAALVAAGCAGQSSPRVAAPVPKAETPSRDRLAGPPFVRRWTQISGPFTVPIGSRGSFLYARSGQGVFAVDVATGEREWRSLGAQEVVSACLAPAALYATVTREPARGAVIRIGLRDGKTNTFTKLPAPPTGLSADERRLYVSDDQRRLRAFDLATGALRWTTQLPWRESRRPAEFRIVPVKNGLYLAAEEGELGVDPASGKVLWQRKVRYAELYPPLVVGGDVITQHGRLARIRVRTGDVVWRGEQGGGDGVAVGGVVIHSAGRKLLAYDAATGRKRWRLALRDAGSGHYPWGDLPTVTDGRRVWFEGAAMVCLTVDGKEQWRQESPLTGTPVYADSTRLITTDGERLLAYTSGSPPPLPTADEDRRALARKWAGEFERLDEAEREQLARLTPHVFEPLLARYVEWSKVDADDPEDGSLYYSLITDSLPILRAAFRPEDTRAVVAAADELDPSNDYQPALIALLRDRGGDEREYIAVLLKKLRALPPKQRGWAPEALSAVAQSAHPDAVAFMLETLRDPAAEPSWRRAAFTHLAGTGGEAGARAVREAKRLRQALKPWYEQVKPGELEGRERIAEKRDSRGRTWLLFRSYVLGNYSDLFVVEKKADGWGRPLFTGVWTERTFREPAPKAFRGIPVKKLVESEWIKIFPDDAAIRRDSDGDGLTDVVEARLGTDRSKVDMDLDGFSDAVDPCPNAAPRSLSEVEKVIAACLDAKFFGYDALPPAVIAVEGVKAFELYGYAGVVLSPVPGKAASLSRVYGGGMNTIGFTSPDWGHSRAGKQQALVVFSEDGKTARTTISRYSGGLNGEGEEATLRKVGDDWFVVKLEGKWVS